MLINYVSLGVLLLVVILLGLLVVRLLRTKNMFLKVGGLIFAGLGTLVFAFLFVFASIGLYKFTQQYDVPTPQVQVAGTPEQIARGEHLANTFCTSCHSMNGELPLSGGIDLAADLSIPLGSFVSSNLTPAGPLAGWSDGEIFRLLRNGIDKNGRKLVFMGTVRSRNLSDDDILALIAYLRSQQPVENDTPQPSDQPNLLALVMTGAGLIPDGPPPFLDPISAPAKAASIEYGEYIFSYQDCRDCHGEDLQGGVQGQLAPVGPNLYAVKGWTAEQFISSMRTGTTPSGDLLEPPMPWQAIGRMDDEELTAMHLYLQSLP